MPSPKPRSSIRQEPFNFFSVWLGGFLLVFMIILVVSASYVLSSRSLSSFLSSTEAHLRVQAKVNTSEIQTDAARRIRKLPRKSLCDTSNKRADICEMEGDIRVQGASSSISFVVPEDWNSTELQKTWHVTPHPRKGMPRITKLSVKTLNIYDSPPVCEVESKFPAVIFSLGGFMGNFFHDFSDVLIPLYLTSSNFNGEVQFLIREMIPWWVEKYGEIFKELSHYEIVDLSQDRVVRCYSEVVVGLKFHKDMGIDPTKSGGLSMVNFGQFLRQTYGLKRDTAIKLGMNEQRRPRMLIIARKWVRRLENIPEIIGYARWMGFEVVVSDKQMNKSLQSFAELVNSCDVVLGVHGAGLTNLVFLPRNAVVIQVVPLGGLESICWSDFGVPASAMKLHYLQYSISPAESTLTQKYSATNPDFPVFTDPKMLLHRDVRNWTNTYFFEQNVKLDIDRFSSVLLQTLEHLREN